MKAEPLLKTKYPGALVDALLDAYLEIERNFVLKKWKASELDSGHFVEAARRIIEHELTGSHTPLNRSLTAFSDAVLRQYETAQGDESLRLLIPRALKAIYNIRNKRGVGHIGAVSPNEMDSTYILYTCKWVLAELVRLASGLQPHETQQVMAGIVERRISVLWKEPDVTAVLDPTMTAKEQTLILLYDQSPQSEDELRAIVDYKNASKYRQLLKELHRKKLIFRTDSGRCLILPPGVNEAERLLAARN